MSPERRLEASKGKETGKTWRWEGLAEGRALGSRPSLKGRVKVAQCPTLCDLMDYTAHRILQARILRGHKLGLSDLAAKVAPFWGGARLGRKSQA